MSNKWTKEEIEILRKEYPTKGANIPKLLEKRSKQCIYVKVQELGIISDKRWSNEEIKILKKDYPNEKAIEVAKKLGRSKNSIILKASKLAIKKTGDFWSSYGKGNKNTMYNVDRPDTSKRNKTEIMREYARKNMKNIHKKFPHMSVESGIKSQISQGMYSGPNNPEKKLINFFEDKGFPFLYTGNGKFWVENFNPDFVCNPSKKIIEFFGDYWHNLPEAKKRDKKRLKKYKKYGFDTLILRKNDLENNKNLFTKVDNFCKK